MSRIRNARPSPAILVAVAALVAALGGSAVAEVATTAKLDKGEKKQVRKIAKKKANGQIKKKAPGLSVASAENADKLDGRDASELTTSSAAVERTSNVDLTSTKQDVLTTTITTTGTRVVAIGIVEVSHNDAVERFVRCDIRIAGTDGITYGSDVQVRIGGSSGEITMSPMSALEVGPGTHPVALRCSGADLTVDDAGLSAWAVGS